MNSAPLTFLLLLLTLATGTSVFAAASPSPSPFPPSSCSESLASHCGEHRYCTNEWLESHCQIAAVERSGWGSRARSWGSWGQEWECSWYQHTRLCRLDTRSFLPGKQEQCWWVGGLCDILQHMKNKVSKIRYNGQTYNIYLCHSPFFCFTENSETVFFL